MAASLSVLTSDEMSLLFTLFTLFNHQPSLILYIQVIRSAIVAAYSASGNIRGNIHGANANVSKASQYLDNLRSNDDGWR